MPTLLFSPGGGSGVGRGNAQFGRGGNFGTHRGRGVVQTSAANPSDTTVIGRYGKFTILLFHVPIINFHYVNLSVYVGSSRGGRGTAAGVGRGISTAQPFNARAQGLYDPRDPRDRPRQRLRSTSDDVASPPFGSVVEESTAPSANSGWTQVGRAAAPWSKRAHANMNATVQNQASAEYTSQPQLPEWMSDDHEKFVCSVF